MTLASSQGLRFALCAFTMASEDRRRPRIRAAPGLCQPPNCAAICSQAALASATCCQVGGSGA